MHHIIKRKGHKEQFDERKVYGSAYAAFLNAHHEKEEAEKFSADVCEDVKNWIAARPEVDSDELFLKITEAIRTRDNDAAFLYETHRDLS